MTETWKGKELGRKKSGRKPDPGRMEFIKQFGMHPENNGLHRRFLASYSWRTQLLTCKDESAQRLLLGRGIKAAPGETWAVPDMRGTGRVVREEAQ